MNLNISSIQKSIIVLVVVLATNLSYSQTQSANHIVLSKQESSKIFSESLNNKLGIKFPIYKVYQCNDASGKYYIVFTESNDKIVDKNDTINTQIKAFKIAENQNKYAVKWEMTDYIKKPSTTDYEENSIWFWTKYAAFNDIDQDGFIEPILVYGTSGMNYTSDGRVKILIYYKDKKIAIRHQNGVLDFERNTQVDKQFYELPKKIQEYVKSIMKKISEDDNAIFPHGWEDNMRKHKLQFDEN